MSPTMTVCTVQPVSTVSSAEISKTSKCFSSSSSSSSTLAAVSIAPPLSSTMSTSTVTVSTASSVPLMSSRQTSTFKEPLLLLEKNKKSSDLPTDLNSLTSIQIEKAEKDLIDLEMKLKSTVSIFFFFNTSIFPINFFKQTMPLEDQQDVVDQIASVNAKLCFLQKAKEIEDQEEIRLLKATAKRNEKADGIRAKNAKLSSNTHNEAMFQREEEERRELVRSMKNSARELGLEPIVRILENYEGKKKYN